MDGQIAKLLNVPFSVIGGEHNNGHWLLDKYCWNIGCRNSDCLPHSTSCWQTWWPLWCPCSRSP